MFWALEKKHVFSWTSEPCSSSLDPKKRSLQNLRHLKVLTKQDIENNSSWINAPIVVTSNEERYRINDQQSIALSRNNKCPRIIWFQEILGIVSSGIDTQQVNYLYATCPRFKGIFVEGAPGFLMQNINPKRGLSNGTPVTFHSLILDSRENQTTILEKMTSGNYEDIVLQYEPKYVLVNITNADPWQL